MSIGQSFNELAYNNECLENSMKIQLSSSGGLSSVVDLETGKKLIVSDCKKYALYVLNITENNGLFDTFKHELIKKPGELCIGKDDQIFVSEHSSGNMIFVFDANLNYLRYIKLKPMYVDKMKIDLTDNQNLLYISD